MTERAQVQLDGFIVTRLGLASAIVLLAARIILSPSLATAQCSPEWLPGEGTAGLDGNSAVLAQTSWDPDGAGPEPPLLVVAGGFWAAGDVAASNIAAWDGQKWRTLGNTAGNEVWDVKALIVYNGQLIAAGGFSTAFGSPANCIARFDVATQSWKPLTGGGMNATVRALTVYNGDLVAAGFFTTAGGQAANHIARWNGTSWS